MTEANGLNTTPPPAAAMAGATFDAPFLFLLRQRIDFLNDIVSGFWVALAAAEPVLNEGSPNEAGALRALVRSLDSSVEEIMSEIRSVQKHPEMLTPLLVAPKTSGVI